MEIKKVLECYKRYLDTFSEQTADSDLFNNYTKMKNFLNSNCTDKELWCLLILDCIGRNIREIEKRGFKIKDVCPSGWNAAVTKEGYRLLRNVEAHRHDYDKSAFVVNFRKFVDLADEQNPYLELYLWYCYNKEENEFLQVSKKDIMEAAANALMAEVGLEDEDNNSTSTEEKITAPTQDD